MTKQDRRTLIVTGGGAGIGQAIAQAFGRARYNIAVADVDESGARKTVSMIEEFGGEAIAFTCDVTDRKQVFRLVQDTEKRFGAVDVLINNAGLAMEATSTEEVCPELVDRMIDINLKSVLWGCQAALPIMRRQKAGVIINMASISGVRPRPGLGIYGASKAAVIGLTKSVALEVAAYGVRCVAVNPVATNTDMLSVIIGEGMNQEEGVRTFVSTIPMGRLATPDDVAQTALFLASEQASMITGSCIDVDGGRGV